MHKKITALLTVGLLPLLSFAAKPLFNVGSPAQVKAGAFDQSTVVTQKGNTLQLFLKKNGSRYQGVILTPAKDKYFDLSKGSVLTFDVQNNSKVYTWVRVEIINLKPGKNPNAFAHCLYSQIALKPGEKAAFRTRYGRIGNKNIDWEPQGMQHNFDGFTKGRFNIVPGEVAQIRIWTGPDKTVPRTLILSNFRLEEPPKPFPEALKSKEAFYPFIDKFGQYKHADWRNKIKSEDDLLAHKKKEDAQLAKLPCIPDRTKFGGWASGPTFDSKGGWGKVKYKGKWFFVDPMGKLFWSLGINTIHDASDDVTGITLRENYFESLPSEKEHPDLYTTARFPRYGFYKKNVEKSPVVKQFFFYRWNMLRKYGKDYHKEFVKRSQRRMSNWGFNTNGNWVHEDILKEEFHHPYISAVRFAKFYNVIEGCKQIGWQKFPDIFDPNFEKGIKEALQNWQKNTTQDPYCIGYFIDNELSWGKTDTFLAEGTIRSRGHQPAKAAMTEYYKKKYTDIAKLNKVWGSSYKSWEDFRNTAKNPVDPKKAKADLEEFNQVIAEAYFTTCKNAINKYAPGKLYFGCRFNDWNVKAIRTAAKYVDGMSFNRYSSHVANFALPEGADCPIIIGEWHYGTTNNGPAHGGLQFAASQKDRARAIDRYVRSALSHPLIVGVHYFKYIDQMATGRPADDENIQCGLVDIADTPYEEVINAFRKASMEMFEYRINGK